MQAVINTHKNFSDIAVINVPKKINELLKEIFGPDIKLDWLSECYEHEKLMQCFFIMLALKNARKVENMCYTTVKLCKKERTKRIISYLFCHAVHI